MLGLQGYALAGAQGNKFVTTSARKSSGKRQGAEIQQPGKGDLRRLELTCYIAWLATLYRTSGSGFTAANWLSTGVAKSSSLLSFILRPNASYLLPRLESGRQSMLRL